jgi:hypothetical protein
VVVASLGPALVAVGLAVLAGVLGWHGVDQAAQTYRVEQIRLHGLVLWDVGWYGGNYPLGYSVLFPVLGAVAGLAGVAVGAAGLASWAFDRLVTGYLGRRSLGSWYFAVSTVLQVAIGQLPFLSGEAFGLAALVALSARRRGLAVLLGVAAALCSPLAAAFLALACLAWTLRSSRGLRSPVLVAVATLVPIGVLGLVFPGDGPFPFTWAGLAVTELLCLVVLTPLVRTTGPVRIGALLYAVASALCYVVPNPLGGNAPRLAAAVGIPLLACFLTAPASVGDRLSVPRLFGRRVNVPSRWKPATVALLIPFALWQWAPGDRVVNSASSSPATRASFYAPLLSQLSARHAAPLRLEIPPTADHWEAAYVAPYVSLARGWERQLDIADNPIFYQPGLLTARSYAQWLTTNGVTWVALPHTPLDYAGVAEGSLLESRTVPDLTLVWSDADWQLWQVGASPGLVSGPARLTDLEPDRVTLSVASAGTITLRVRYTSHWSVAQGSACVTPGPDGWTQIRARQAGTLQLSASVLTGRATCPT